MRYILSLFIAVFVFVSFANAQELSRSQKIEELRIVSSQVEQTENQLDTLRRRRQKMLDGLLAVSSQDKAEAERIGANAVRLFPDDILDTEIEERSYSVYPLTEIARYYFAPRLEYKKDKLIIVKQEDVVAFMANIGGTLPETINDRTKEVIALAKYESPEDSKDAENEIIIDGLTFGKSVPVVVGSTYILRGISYGSGDGIVAIRIHHKDSDGSIVLFVKKIRDLSPPEPETIISTDNYQSIPPPRVADEAAKKAVEEALKRKGFNEVTVEATTTEIILRGTVPKGKLGEAVMTASVAAKRKVNNQLTERR